MNRGTRERELCCSFCGKSQSEAKKLVAGPGVCICDECVNLCTNILDEEAGSLRNRKRSLHGADSPKENKKVLPKPHEIKNYLDEYVVGQDEAKNIRL